MWMNFCPSRSIVSSGWARWAVFAAFAVLSLGACGPPWVLGETTVLSGTIEAWTRGAGYEIVLASEPVVTAPIAEDGSFHVPLPGGGALGAALAPFPTETP